MLGHVQLFVTLWTGTLQASLSMEFSMQTTKVGCRFLLYEIFQNQGLNLSLLCLLHWQVDSLLLSHLGFPSAPKLLVIREFHQEGSCSLRTTSSFQKVRRKREQLLGWKNGELS